MKRFWTTLFILFLAVPVLLGAPRKKKQPCVDTLQACPEKGCGGDAALNPLKNRTDDAGDAEDWTLSQIINLNEETPDTWKQSDPRDPLEELGEGTLVVVKGYLIHGDVTKTPESCNCYLPGEQNNDFHLNLVARKSDELSASVVAEITPRLRRSGWTKAKVRAIAESEKYVRVTGWLLFDSMHASNFSPSSRATVWEVHPVTKFDVCTKTKKECDAGQGWQRLENYQ